MGFRNSHCTSHSREFCLTNEILFDVKLFLHRFRSKSERCRCQMVRATHELPVRLGQSCLLSSGRFDSTEGVMFTCQAHLVETLNFIFFRNHNPFFVAKSNNNSFKSWLTGHILSLLRRALDISNYGISLELKWGTFPERFCV